MFWIPGTDIARFQTEGLILDLGPLAAADGLRHLRVLPGADVPPHLRPEAGAPGDKLWGLPRDVSTFALYLNNDLIAEAGADDPRALAEAGEWDWETFAGGGRAGRPPSAATTRASRMNSWWANYGYFMNAAGGGFFNEDRTACALDTDGVDRRPRPR